MPSDQEKDFGQKVFSQFVDIFVGPEIKRRQDAGQLPSPLDLHAAQIVFYSDGRQTQVRINSEVRAVGAMKLRSGISKEKGDFVYENEVEGLENLSLMDDEDPNCAHATLVRVGNAWTIAFDFRYNKGLAKEHLQTARQFLEAAEFSYNHNNWAAFIDNLFSTSELIAKASLLLMPDPKFMKKSSHREIQIRYNRFSAPGSTNAEYKEVFNKLSGLRDRARYLKADFSVSDEHAKILLDTTSRMLSDAESLIKS